MLNRLHRQFCLSPLAWLKWQFLCHAGPTEVAALGLSAAHDPLYLTDLLVVRQRATAVTVSLDDAAIADLFDQMVDAGVSPQRFGRTWLHTHPGDSARPSVTDEQTFARVFGGCDWSVMAILSRTGATYARVQFQAGPGGALELPVQVDWAAWPAYLATAASHLATHVAAWHEEYQQLVEPAPLDWPPFVLDEAAALAEPLTELDYFSWEELYAPHTPRSLAEK